MLIPDLVRILLIGVGATAVMDVWLAFLTKMGAPTLNFALIGRWIGHVLHGQVRHGSIAKAAPIPGEIGWGWSMHYATGVAFAGVLVGVEGFQWTREPSLIPAVVVGVVTVVAPLFLMQPAMGAGIASSKTPTPLRNCIRSLANHTVFGIGLYLSALAIAAILN
jgi:hypothetical protein